jgi:hypothetical protein
LKNVSHRYRNEEQTQPALTVARSGGHHGGAKNKEVMEVEPNHSAILGTLGCTGLGLVWGWLIGSLNGHAYRLRRTIPLVLLAAMVISAQVLWFLDWVRLLGFYGAALFGWVIHVELRRKLSNFRTNSNSK